MKRPKKVFCVFDGLVCEQFTNDFDASYAKALAGKLCSVCPRFGVKRSGA